MRYAPGWGLLVVRRQRAFGSCIVGAATYRLRSALLFGRFLVALLLRSSPLCALTLRMRRVARLRKLRSSSECSRRLSRCFGHGRLKVRGARSIIRSSVFGQLVRSSAPLASGPPNKSFKPTPCRGGSHVLCATLARVRRPATGRLNSGVRQHRGDIWDVRTLLQMEPTLAAQLNWHQMAHTSVAGRSLHQMESTWAAGLNSLRTART
jgi:hypothetical protein